MENNITTDGKSIKRILTCSYYQLDTAGNHAKDCQVRALEEYNSYLEKIYTCRICKKELTDEEVFCLKPRAKIITCFKHDYLSQSSFDYNSPLNKTDL